MPEAKVELPDGRQVVAAQFGWRMGWPPVRKFRSKRVKIFEARLPSGEWVPIAPEGHAKAKVLSFKE